MAGYTITCKQCGNLFQTPDKRRQFCVRACFADNKRITLAIKFWTKVTKTKTCWLWTAAISDNGYGVARVKKGRNEQAHRVSWQLHFGPIPDGLYVLHRCDVRNCVRPDHLFLGTRKDNMEDCAKKGRQSSKLNPDAVRAIRSRFADGDSARSIAADFQVDRSMIHLIVKRVWWTHVT